MLNKCFQLQKDLQEKAYGKDITDLPIAERIEQFRIHMLALNDELHEALAETSWKPWQDAEYWNEREVKGELVDAFHFFMNLCLLSGMTAEELVERYEAKRKVNIKRQEDGYDGVSTKDPVTKKALDEPMLPIDFA